MNTSFILIIVAAATAAFASPIATATTGATVTVTVTACSQQETHIRGQADYEADVAEFKEWEQLFELRAAQKQQKAAEYEANVAKWEKEYEMRVAAKEQAEDIAPLLLHVPDQSDEPAEKRDAKRKHGAVCNVL